VCRHKNVEWADVGDDSVNRNVWSLLFADIIPMYCTMLVAFYGRAS